jgi:hypothetical protein
MWINIGDVVVARNDAHSSLFWAGKITEDEHYYVSGTTGSGPFPFIVLKADDGMFRTYHSSFFDIVKRGSTKTTRFVLDEITS